LSPCCISPICVRIVKIAAKHDSVNPYPRTNDQISKQQTSLGFAPLAFRH
jgi:hypothetical protein